MGEFNEILNDPSVVSLSVDETPQSNIDSSSNKEKTANNNELDVITKLLESASLAAAKESKEKTDSVIKKDIIVYKPHLLLKLADSPMVAQLMSSLEMPDQSFWRLKSTRETTNNTGGFSNAKTRKAKREPKKSKQQRKNDQQDHSDTPQWMLDNDGPVGNSLQDFEVWRLKMRLSEKKRNGIDVTKEEIEELDRLSSGSTLIKNGIFEEPLEDGEVLEPDNDLETESSLQGNSIDNFFGAMIGEYPSDAKDEQKHKNANSRFSSLFKPESEDKQVSSPDSVESPELRRPNQQQQQQPQHNQKQNVHEQNHPQLHGSQSHMLPIQHSQLPPPPQQQHSSQPQRSSQHLHHHQHPSHLQHSLHPQHPQQQQRQQAQQQQQQQPPSSNDHFFMNLLNRSKNPDELPQGNGPNQPLPMGYPPGMPPPNFFPPGLMGGHPNGPHGMPPGLPIPNAQHGVPPGMSPNTNAGGAPPYGFPPNLPPNFIPNPSMQNFAPMPFPPGMNPQQMNMPPQKVPSFMLPPELQNMESEKR